METTLPTPHHARKLLLWLVWLAHPSATAKAHTGNDSCYVFKATQYATPKLSIVQSHARSFFRPATNIVIIIITTDPDKATILASTSLWNRQMLPIGRRPPHLCSRPSLAANLQAENQPFICLLLFLLFRFKN